METYTKRIFRDANGNVVKRVYTTPDYKPIKSNYGHSRPGKGALSAKAQEQLFWMNVDLRAMLLVLQLQDLLKKYRRR